MYTYLLVILSGSWHVNRVKGECLAEASLVVTYFDSWGGTHAHHDNAAMALLFRCSIAYQSLAEEA